MPLYEYVCDGCQNVFEKHLPMAENREPLNAPCPKCGEIKVRQMFGSNALLDPHRMGRIKAPEGFRDLLRNIKKRNHGSVLDIN